MRLERWLYTLPLRLRSLFRRNRVEGELDEEFRYHLEHLIDEHVARGMTPGEARNAALRAMGGVEQRKEECRDARGLHFIESTFQDLRYSVRNLRSHALRSGALAAMLLPAWRATRLDPLITLHCE